MKPKEEVFGCGEGGYAGDRNDERWSFSQSLKEKPL